MKIIRHQIFLKNNSLEVGLLLQPIQEEIEIFNRMYALLEGVSDCEKDHLLEQLETLDLEIMEDLDEEYADQLEHNEIIEEISNTKPNLEKIEQEKNKKSPIQEKPKKLTDESILDELVKMKRTQNIKRSTLKDLGVKTLLNWETIIGKYKVSRTSVFTYTYSIEIK